MMPVRLSSVGDGSALAHYQNQIKYGFNMGWQTAT